MRFLVISDTKGKDHGINKEVVSKLLRQSQKLSPQPEFIVHCGDSVAGSMEYEVMTSQLLKLKSLVESYYPDKPFLPVIGNHEVNKYALDDRYEKILGEVYENLSPSGFLHGYNNTVYYMDFGDTRLIILNAFHYGSIYKIDKEQLTWLEEEGSAEKKNKLLFVHSPAFPTGAHLGHCLDLYPEERNSFWTVVDKCGFDIVFSGHEHNYSRRIIDSSFNREGIDYKKKTYQIVTGGGGERLKDKYRSKEGVVIPPIDVHHFVVVDVLENGITVTAISSGGRILDEFKIEK